MKLPKIKFSHTFLMADAKRYFWFFVTPLIEFNHTEYYQHRDIKLRIGWLIFVYGIDAKIFKK